MGISQLRILKVDDLDDIDDWQSVYACVSHPPACVGTVSPRQLVCFDQHPPFPSTHSEHIKLAVSTYNSFFSIVLGTRRILQPPTARTFHNKSTLFYAKLQKNDSLKVKNRQCLKTSVSGKYFCSQPPCFSHISSGSYSYAIETVLTHWNGLGKRGRGLGDKNTPTRCLHSSARFL